MKYLLTLLLLINISLADNLKVIESMDDIPRNKNVLLMFSMNFCPYCMRQESSILNNIKPQFPNISYLKVKKGTDIYQKLIETGNFGEVEYFPTTFILIKEDDGTIFVKYPFKGLQRSKDMIRILNDKDIMED
jgi:glutaredoxin